MLKENTTIPLFWCRLFMDPSQSSNIESFNINGVELLSIERGLSLPGSKAIASTLAMTNITIETM